MSTLSLFLADGFEEIEALTVVDMLRRAGADIQTVSITGNRMVTGSHHISVMSDVLFEQAEFKDTIMYVLPGGMPGTLNLKSCDPLGKLLCQAARDGKYIAAICAAPTVLGYLGLLKGKKATCYPSPDLESQLDGAEHLTVPVVIDGNIITSRGMGTAIDFSAALISKLYNSDVAEKILENIVYRTR